MPDMLGSQVQLSAVKEKDAEEDQASRQRLSTKPSRSASPSAPPC